MSENDLIKQLLSGKAPRHIRMLLARGAMPLPAAVMLESLVYLSRDAEDDISRLAIQTLASWDEEEVLSQIRQKECPQSVLEYFANSQSSQQRLQIIIANPSASGKLIASLATFVSPQLLEIILDNRTRIIESPEILENIRKNPAATPENLRLAQEIEVEFLRGKRKEYSVGTEDETEEVAETGAGASSETATEIEIEITHLLTDPPEGELSLEGLPPEGDSRVVAITSRISTMPVREKVKYALFGSREIRAMLIRDTNKEVARAVLRSPKIRESEIESIAAMRNVAEDILREIGNSREWIKSTPIVQSLVKNPKTPPMIAQRLMFRLTSRDLQLLSRDRSIPDATRQAATRLVKNRLAMDRGHK